MTNYLLFALSFSFACVVQPGPFQAYLLSQSLLNGWRKSLHLVLIPPISDIPVIILMVLILSSLPKGMLLALQLVGGAFLLYLAYKAFLTWKRYSEIREEAPVKSSAFFKGIAVNVLNPNAYIGWGLVMGPMLIKAWHEAPANGVVLLAAFYGSMVIYSAGLVMLFALARNFGPKVTRASVLVSAVALAFFGCYQLVSGAGIKL